MSLDSQFIDYFQYETGRSLNQLVIRWLENQFDILHDDARDIENLSDDVSQVTEYNEIKNRIAAINNVLNALDGSYTISNLPTDFPYVKQELEDYKFFLEYEAIPDADNGLMRHISESDVALIKALISMWPN